MQGIENQTERWVRFTLREAELMEGLLAGKNPIQIAKDLSLSLNTVYFYLRGLKEKYDLLLKKMHGKTIDSETIG